MNGKPKKNMKDRHLLDIGVTPLGVRIGAAVTGISLDRVPEGPVLEALEHLLETWGVLVFPGQDISPAQQVQFSRALGELEPSGWANARLDGQPEIFVIGNSGHQLTTFAGADALSDEGESLDWHADHMCRADPARASLSYCLQAPPRGGDTVFACMYSAFDGLSPSDKAQAEGLIALHSVNPVENADGDVTDGPAGDARLVRWPLVRHHPRSGRKALYFGSRVTVGIEGWDDARARAYLDRLKASATRPEFQYRHVWQDGDAVLWDNRRVLHAGTPFDAAHYQREIHRITIREDRPIR